MLESMYVCKVTHAEVTFIRRSMSMENRNVCDSLAPLVWFGVSFPFHVVTLVEENVTFPRVSKEANKNANMQHTISLPDVRFRFWRSEARCVTTRRISG